MGARIWKHADVQHVGLRMQSNANYSCAGRALPCNLGARMHATLPTAAAQCARCHETWECAHVCNITNCSSAMRIAMQLGNAHARNIANLSNPMRALPCNLGTRTRVTRRTSAPQCARCHATWECANVHSKPQQPNARVAMQPGNAQG